MSSLAWQRLQPLEDIFLLPHQLFQQNLQHSLLAINSLFLTFIPLVLVILACTIQCPPCSTPSYFSVLSTPLKHLPLKTRHVCFLCPSIVPYPFCPCVMKEFVKNFSPEQDSFSGTIWYFYSVKGMKSKKQLQKPIAISSLLIASWLHGSGSDLFS